MSKRETPQPFPNLEGPEKEIIIEALTKGDDKALEQAGGKFIRGLSKEDIKYDTKLREEKAEEEQKLQKRREWHKQPIGLEEEAGAETRRESSEQEKGVESIPSHEDDTVELVKAELRQEDVGLSRAIGDLENKRTFPFTEKRREKKDKFYKLQKKRKIVQIALSELNALPEVGITHSAREEEIADEIQTLNSKTGELVRKRVQEQLKLVEGLTNEELIKEIIALQNEIGNLMHQADERYLELESER